MAYVAKGQEAAIIALGFVGDGCEGTTVVRLSLFVAILTR
jgi:hypothetical protein